VWLLGWWRGLHAGAVAGLELRPVNMTLEEALESSYPGHMTVEAGAPVRLRSDAMRYRKEFHIRQLAEVLAVGLIVSLFYPTRSLLTCLECGLVYALVWFAFYFYRYWEIRTDCLIQRFFFRRIVFPFSDITYVGPMKGDASNFEYFDKTILIETADGRRMYARPADPEAFLADMRKHLPAITLHL